MNLNTNDLNIEKHAKKTKILVRKFAFHVKTLGLVRICIKESGINLLLLF